MKEIRVAMTHNVSSTLPFNGFHSLLFSVACLALLVFHVNLYFSASFQSPSGLQEILHCILIKVSLVYFRTEQKRTFSESTAVKSKHLMIKS